MREIVCERERDACNHITTIFNNELGTAHWAKRPGCILDIQANVTGFQAVGPPTRVSPPGAPQNIVRGTARRPGINNFELLLKNPNIPGNMNFILRLKQTFWARVAQSA
jgi:hypothetical protein